MWKKILGGFLLLCIASGALGWHFRETVILKIASIRGKVDIAPHRPVTWARGPEVADRSADQRRPNIIFILADDLGINDISTFGGGVASGRVRTPNIDRLATGGAMFTQAYSGTGTCAPSRAMLMTGRYPTRTGFEFTPVPDGLARVVSLIDDPDATGLPPIELNRERPDDIPNYENQGLPGPEITVAETLKKAGYHTVHIGKWHLGRSPESRPTAQGFDESLLMASGLFLPENDKDVVNARLDFDPLDKFLWARMQYAAAFNSGDWFAPGGYLTDYWTDEALKVIDANRNRPFFLYLAHWGVHTPLQATRADYEAVGDIQPHRLRVYAAMVRALDRSVGRIMDGLQSAGLAENTLIVFSSDNGGAGYIGLPEVNQPYRGWKITLFEGGIRVPLFLNWPAQIKPGTRISDPVAHIDVMPTMAAAAGATLAENVEIDGQNLLPSATGTGTVVRPDNAIFWQSGHYRVVRAGDWKLQVDGRQNKAWLFDLATDPTEQKNLATSRPDQVTRLTGMLDRHQSKGRSPLYPYMLQVPISIDRTMAERHQPGDEMVYVPN